MSDIQVMRVMQMRPAARPEPHPAPVPAEAVIYNGPRPLMGTPAADMGLSWMGAPILGSYYAAVDLGHPLAAQATAHNVAAGAVVVEYLTADLVRSALRTYYGNVLNMDADEIAEQLTAATTAGLWQQYVDAGLHVELAPA